MNRYLIVADDFTGANDTGVQLARRGFHTSVVLDSEGIQNDQSSYVLDTETRGDDPGKAYQKVYEMIGAIDFSRFHHVIKKVDSTLRGNIGQEIKAIDQQYQADLVVFMPALPDLGRTTEEGIHKLNGTPITRTELAKDPKTPVTEDSIVKLLQAVYDEEVKHIDISQLEQNNIDFGSARVYAVDAATNEHMQQVVAAALDSHQKILWVGTAALADNLLESAGQVKPAMALITSVSEVTREQIHYCEANGTRLVVVPIPELLAGADARIYVQQAVQCLQQGRDVIVAADSSYERDNLEKSYQVGARIGKSQVQLSEWVQQTMAKIAEEIIAGQPVAGLFLTGGDTAIGFFRQVGARGSCIEGEVAVGIPVMKLCGGRLDGLKVITKAGAFGKTDAIHYALRKLKECPPRSGN